MANVYQRFLEAPWMRLIDEIIGWKTALI